MTRVEIKLVAENEDWESLSRGKCFTSFCDCKVMDYIITGNAVITQQNCWEIYMCSDRYDIPKLKAIAEESLKHTMSLWGLEDVLKFWELLEGKELTYLLI